MRSIKEQREDLIAGDRIDELEMLDWAERARVWLQIQLDDGDYTLSQYEDLKKLLAELPE